MRYAPAIMRMWSRLGPSGAIGAAALELGATNENVLFLSADMTFAAGLEGFRNRFPDRHFEVGIAEQNLIGVAAGLASEDFIPYAVTYSTFLAGRALDQVKMCLGYMQQPVKLIGLNAGFAAGILGPTHMALEDISAMRAIPNMTVISPGDTAETVKALIAAVDYEGPVFIRLTGEMNQPQIYTDDYEFEIGKAIKLREGKDISIIASGAVLYHCLGAADILQEKGIDAAVINMHTIKPLDLNMLDALLDQKMIVTVEEHNIIGGLGSAVAEILSEKKGKPIQLRIGVKDRYPHASSYQKLMEENELDEKGIANRIEYAYRKEIE